MRLTGRQLAQRSGLTGNQLRHWDNTGLLCPSVRRTGGRMGRGRIYDEHDLEWAQTFHALLEAGVTAHRLRKWFEEGHPLEWFKEQLR